MASTAMRCIGRLLYVTRICARLNEKRAQSATLRAQRGKRLGESVPSGGLFRHHRLPPAVIAAVLACLVGQLHFMAVGTLCQRGLAQVIVCAAPIAPGMGVPSFWIWHDSLFPICAL